MKLRVIERNRSHVKVNVFTDGALNGTLCFIPDEWRQFKTLVEAEIKELNQPRCEVCERRKKPIGRDSRDNGLCDQDCEGYHMDPEPGTEWD